MDLVRKVKGLEAENARLRQAGFYLTLDKIILAEAVRGNFKAPGAAFPAFRIYCPN